MKKEYLDIDIDTRGKGGKSWGATRSNTDWSKAAADFSEFDKPVYGATESNTEAKAEPAKSRGRPRKAKGKPRGTQGTNKWLQLVKKVKADNPGITYKQALQAASHIRAEHGYDEALGAGFHSKE